MLRTRVATGLALISVASFFIFWGSDFLWQILLLSLMFIMGYEWSRFAKEEKYFLRLSWGLVFVVIIFLLDKLLSNINNLEYFFLIPLIMMIYFVFWYQSRKGAVLVKNKLVLFLLGIISLYPLYYSMMILKYEFSIYIILLSFIAIWAFDTGAFFTGKKFGKTKLAFYISPGKTWEGVYGGAIFSFVLIYIAIYIVQPEINISYVVLAIILSSVAVLSLFGDLFESALKRQVLRKDSSRILPGHGGFLDRLDSLIFAMPLYLIVWQLVQLR